MVIKQVLFVFSTAPFGKMAEMVQQDGNLRLTSKASKHSYSMILCTKQTIYRGRSTFLRTLNSSATVRLSNNNRAERDLICLCAWSWYPSHPELLQSPPSYQGLIGGSFLRLKLLSTRKTGKRTSPLLGERRRGWAETQIGEVGLLLIRKQN